MDDGATVDLVDVSPIGSPDHLRVPTKRLWGGREPHSDDEADDTGVVADNPDYHNGPPQWLPYSRRDFRRIKSLTVDTSLSPFPSSSGYLSTIEGTPSPLSSTSDCFDVDDSSSPLAKFDEAMRFQYSPDLSRYDSEDLNGARPWNLHCNFSAMWDGEDSDGSEASDESKGYITFAGESVSSSPEVGLDFQQFNLSEPSAFVLDFPEDVGELLEHDGVSVDGDSGAIGSTRRPTSAPAPEITVELSVHTTEGPQDPPDYAPNIFLPQVREAPEDSAESETFPHIPYPEPGVANLPINVPLSPLMLTTDGFPDDTSTLHSDPVGVEVEETSADMDWLEGPLEEMACSPCLGDFLEWDRWHGRQAEELDRDLDSWARVHQSVRAGLDRF